MKIDNGFLMVFELFIDFALSKTGFKINNMLRIKDQTIQQQIKSL